MHQTARHPDLCEGDHLSLAFDNGYRLWVSLQPEDYITPEAAQFTPDGLEQGTWAW